MLGIGSGELIVILIVGLVMIGPQQLPAVARAAGRVIGKASRTWKLFQHELNTMMDEGDDDPDQNKDAR